MGLLTIFSAVSAGDFQKHDESTRRHFLADFSHAFLYSSFSGAGESVCLWPLTADIITLLCRAFRSLSQAEMTEAPLQHPAQHQQAE